MVKRLYEQVAEALQKGTSPESIAPVLGISVEMVKRQEELMRKNGALTAKIVPVSTRPQSALAETIAREAHQGQFRRDKVTPYITHPEAVAKKIRENGGSDETEAVAWLHDVVEDCPSWTAERLEKAGLSDEVVDAVLTLTKLPGDDYEEYIMNIWSVAKARDVKIQDILHNLSCKPNPKSIEKYLGALEVLFHEHY